MSLTKKKLADKLNTLIMETYEYEENVCHTGVISDLKLALKKLKYDSIELDIKIMSELERPTGNTLFDH